MDMELQGRRVLVTGGSKGIGLGIAQRFAQEGAHVCLVARSQDELDAAAQQIRSSCAVEVTTLAVDLSARDAVEKIVRAQPEIDILVNNAGDIPGGSLEDVSEEAWRHSWDVKVFGYINLSRAYLPSMKRQRAGVMLNIIGVAGEMLDANYIAGSVGNAALMAFTRSLGSTSLDFGVRVLGINPGPVRTDRVLRILKKRAAQRLGDENRAGELEANFPLGRGAEVDEIAASAVLLCSPLSAYTSGSILTIDGGLSCRRSIA